jgi:hypothetical protein
VIVQGRLPGYSGTLLVYGQKNADTPFVLASVASPTTGTAVINCSREISGFAASDSLKIYLAPADASGAVAAAVTCNVEIDVTIYNW